MVGDIIEKYLNYLKNTLKSHKNEEGDVMMSIFTFRQLKRTKSFELISLDNCVI